MPIVASKLRDLFSCPVELTDPDLIVARGAAMAAASSRLSARQTPARSRSNIPFRPPTAGSPSPAA